MQAAEIDTVIDSRLVVDSLMASPREAHEINVIGTMNILAACGGPDSPVRKVVFKSSAHYYGCERDDPAFFTETMQRPHPPSTRLESDIVEAENAVRGFAERNKDVTVTVLRFANGLGPDLHTSHSRLLRLPAIPCILGFDPRYQFVHEDDIVGVLEHAVGHDLPGIFNVAGDGVLVLSEVASLLGKPLAPDPAAVGHRARHRRARAGRRPHPGGDGAPAALRPRPRQPQAQGGRLHAPLHDARGRPEVRRGPARAGASPRRRDAVPVRTRGRGVPALQPLRTRGSRQELTCQLRCSYSW